jgi:hypothetical protein
MTWLPGPTQRDSIFASAMDTVVVTSRSECSVRANTTAVGLCTHVGQAVVPLTGLHLRSGFSAVGVLVI